MQRTTTEGSETRPENHTRIDKVGAFDHALIDGTLRIKLTSTAEPQIIKIGDTYELRLPVTFDDGKATIVEEFVW